MNAGTRLFESPPKIFFRWGVICFILFSLFTLNLPFYGDHVSIISAPANYIFDTGFRSLVLPHDLDTGHPPFYALAHAGLWKIFGRDLWVSHFISLSAALFLLNQFRLFCKNNISENAQKIAIVFFVLQPTVLAQISLMSSDILLCGLFLWGLNAIQKNNFLTLLFAIAFLLLTSVRGIILTGFLFIALFYFSDQLKQKFKKYLLIFFAGILPGCSWYLFHYFKTGWFLTNPQSPWAAGRAFIGLSAFPAAVFEYVFRYIEFGMIIPWLIILFCNKKIRHDNISKKTAFFLLTGFLFFSFFLIFFKNPVMIRYILPVQIIALILCARSIASFSKSKFKKIAISSCILIFIAQHFFAYPQMNSSVFEYSWGEGSLAHLSYFKFRKEGANYFATHHIDPDLVHTGFPEYKSFKNTNLDTSCQRAYLPFEESEMGAYPYVIYSNIMNGISKTAETALKTRWIRCETWYAYPVEYIIFQNPETIKNY